ncbi:MAG: diadenosine tetraphosphate hydrolase [Candidatus Aenigmatarchaeota archaeon]|nr:MAG: diadenosine tetraphosphate hydrolase [Candidatus Aenigmarchaeota archaeon]
MEKENSAGVVVFRRNKEMKFLLLQYGEEGYWGPPKGKIEEGETPEETAIRETKEETNLDVKLIDGFKEEIRYFYYRDGKRINKKVIYFLGEGFGRVKISFEHTDFRWVTLKEALAIIRFRNLRNVILKAAKFLEQRNLLSFM